MMVFSTYVILLCAVFVCTLQHRDDRGRDSIRRPSPKHLNFLAAIIGTYGKTSMSVGNIVMPTNNSLSIRPITTNVLDWPLGATLFAEERLNGAVVRRSLYISIEKDDGNTILFYPYNFTSEFAEFSRDFSFPKLNNLLVTDLDYTHKCDRVVKPSTTQSNAFDFVSWPYCSGNNVNPPIYSAVLTCNAIKVSFTEVSLLPTTPAASRMYFTLEKTKKLALPYSYTEGYRNYRNPCA